MCKEIIGFVHGIENVLDCTTVYSTLLYVMLAALVELKLTETYLMSFYFMLCKSLVIYG